MNCFNGDLETVVTPVKVDKLVAMLRQTGYSADKIEFLEHGFRYGFHIGYEGPTQRHSQSDNLPFTIGNKTVLWNKLMKEVSLKRVAGPFEQIPFRNFIQSPIGLVPKVGGEQTRLIFHLSYDFKKSDNLKSLNHFTLKDKCTVKYKDLDFAVQAYLQLYAELLKEDENDRKGSWKEKYDRKSHKRNKPIIYAGKSDIKSAFRILGLTPWSWQWLVMKAQDPITNEWRYFMNKCLPFGASISCALFQNFSDALCHIVQFKAKVPKRITNYLDDFLFIAWALGICNQVIQVFLDTCAQLGVPVAMEKTEWATELIVFLGILLDGRNMVLAIPQEKRTVAVELLQSFLCKHKSMVRDMQKLCGLLNFIGRSVFPGRTFTRRMYSKYAGVVNLGGTPVAANQFKLKQHHHVRLDSQFKFDCQVWLDFLTGDLQTVVCRPMVDVIGNSQTSQEIKFYSDASASEKWGGFGAVLNSL